MKRHAIRGGYSVCGGRTGDGWYAGVLVLSDADSPFLEAPVDDSFERNVRRCRRWEASCIARPRRVLLARPEGDGLALQEVASAERIDGPVCPREPVPSPLLAWTERRAGGWEYLLHRDGDARTVLRQAGVLRFPQVALTSDGPVMACERDGASGRPEVIVFREDGSVLLRERGRNPKLVAAGDGMLLLTERASANSVTLRLVSIEGGKRASEVEIGEGDYLMNADVAWSEAGGEAFIAAESSPAFGYGSQLGLHRTLHVWRWRDGIPTYVSPEANGALPVERRAFMSLGPENLPPIRPYVFVEDGEDGEGGEDGSPVVAFRQFRYFRFKTFGWDVFWCRWNGTRWSDPVRLSPSQGTPDTSYGIVPVGDRYVALFPALENGGGPARSVAHRVEIFEFDEFDAEHALDRYEVPEKAKAAYTFPKGHRDIAPRPPDLPEPYAGRRLVWGDLHVHTTYSKCVGAADGGPDEHLRYARDVLGCSVFTLTDHSRHMTGPESTWVMDRLEILAGDAGVVLYSTEPGMNRVRHTNWYARDRRTFERLERILLAQGKDLQACLRHVREELPHDAVLVMRHFHGHIADEREMLQGFEPELEVAMEAMQGRCNAMLEPEGDAPRFPNQFLDAGCKLGLLGGTDHYRRGPNRFCLTGLWVRDLSPRGVWEAIRNRYTVAMSDAKVAMSTYLEAKPMGSTAAFDAASEITVRLCASCARPIRRATLIRDGHILPWVDVGACVASLDIVDRGPPAGRHWYVPTVEVETAYGDGDVGYCHASPFFVMVRP